MMFSQSLRSVKERKHSNDKPLKIRVAAAHLPQPTSWSAPMREVLFTCGSHSDLLPELGWLPGSTCLQWMVHNGPCLKKALGNTSFIHSHPAYHILFIITLLCFFLSYPRSCIGHLILPTFTLPKHPFPVKPPTPHLACVHVQKYTVAGPKREGGTPVSKLVSR